MKYIIAHRDTLNVLIEKYSTLGVQYPAISYEDIQLTPCAFELELTFDDTIRQIIINESKLSSQEKFVLLYFQTLELVQICVDIHNEFERKGKELPLIPLKNGIAFISTKRSLEDIPHVIDPRSWNTLIGDKNSAHHHAYL